MIEGKRFPSPPRPGWTTTKMPTSFQVRIARPSLAILYLGINAVVLGFACIPPYVGADGTNRVVKGWIFAASTGGILLSSIVYYFAVIPDRSGHPWKIMWSIKRWSVIQLTGAQARIEEREGGFDESYGFKRTLQIAFQEDTLAALVSNLNTHTIPRLICNSGCEPTSKTPTKSSLLALRRYTALTLS
jgi:hypothetical protein